MNEHTDLNAILGSTDPAEIAARFRAKSPEEQEAGDASFLGEKFANGETFKPEEQTPELEIHFATGLEETATMEHLIDPWLPENKVVGFYGRGEVGKSSFLNWLCAQVSSSGSTLWVSSEEEKDHISVRFKNSGGDPYALAVMSHMPKIAGTETRVSFDVFEHLESAIIQAKSRFQKPLKCVVLDAVQTLVVWEQGENANDDRSVKRLFAHLMTLSETHSVTICVIGHVNKNTNKTHHADAVTGSAAWTNSPRRAFLFYKDIGSDSDYDNFVRTAKANTGTDFAASYRTVPVQTLHDRKGEGANEVLCSVELTSEIVWGNKAIDEMLYDDQNENPRAEAQTKKKNKRAAKINACYIAIVEHRCADRPSIQAKVEEIAKVKILGKDFTNYIDDGLTKRGIRCEVGLHNKFSYTRLVE